MRDRRATICVPVPSSRNVHSRQLPKAEEFSSGKHEQVFGSKLEDLFFGGSPPQSPRSRAPSKGSPPSASKASSKQGTPPLVPKPLTLPAPHPATAAWDSHAEKVEPHTRKLKELQAAFNEQQVLVERRQREAQALEEQYRSALSTTGEDLQERSELEERAGAMRSQLEQLGRTAGELDLERLKLAHMQQRVTGERDLALNKVEAKRERVADERQDIDEGNNRLQTLESSQREAELTRDTAATALVAKKEKLAVRLQRQRAEYQALMGAQQEERLESERLEGVSETAAVRTTEELSDLVEERQRRLRTMRHSRALGSLKVMEQENAAQRIRRETGITGPENLYNAFLQHPIAAKELSTTVQQRTETLESLREEYDTLKFEYPSVRPPSPVRVCRLTDEFEAPLKDSAARLKKAQDKYCAVSAIEKDTLAYVTNLSDRLAAIQAAPPASSPTGDADAKQKRGQSAIDNHKRRVGGGNNAALDVSSVLAAAKAEEDALDLELLSETSDVRFMLEGIEMKLELLSELTPDPEEFYNSKRDAAKLQKFATGLGLKQQDKPPERSMKARGLSILAAATAGPLWMGKYMTGGSRSQAPSGAPPPILEVSSPVVGEQLTPTPSSAPKSGGGKGKKQTNRKKALEQARAFMRDSFESEGSEAEDFVRQARRAEGRVPLSTLTPEGKPANRDYTLSPPSSSQDQKSATENVDPISKRSRLRNGNARGETRPEIANEIEDAYKTRRAAIREQRRAQARVQSAR